jgi:hypothetical protein
VVVVAVVVGVEVEVGVGKIAGEVVGIAVVEDEMMGVG